MARPHFTRRRAVPDGPAFLRLDAGKEEIGMNDAHHIGGRPAALPYLAVAFGVLALGCSALFVRWAYAPGTVTGLYRMGIASLALLPLAIRRGGHRPWPRRWVVF